MVVCVGWFIAAPTTPRACHRAANSDPNASNKKTLFWFGVIRPAAEDVMINMIRPIGGSYIMVVL